MSKRSVRTKRRTKPGDELAFPDQTGTPARPQEQLLIERLDEFDADTVLCNTAGRGQFARALATRFPETRVSCLFLDLYQLQQSAREDAEPVPNLERVCLSDFPEPEVDVAVIFCSARGIAELSRDLLQQAYQRLAHRGRIVAAIDQPEDQWLHEELHKLFPKVTRDPVKKQGVIYTAVKSAPLAKEKVFDAEIVFRDQTRLIRLHSRPGVFSHRRLDPGARALLNEMVIHPQMRVLDLGCGTGAVGIAAALRQPDAEVWAVDSNPRAVQCARLGAEQNHVTTLTAQLDADGSSIPAQHFDLILANPPYYSQYRLAELFLRTTVRSLQDRGELLMVTKSPTWFREHLSGWFHDVMERQQKEYFVFVCKRPVIKRPRDV